MPNPTTLISLSPSASAPLYVEMMGGADRIMAKGRQLIDQGTYLAATEIMNTLVYAAAEPGGEGLAGGRVRADRLPTGESRPAQQLPCWRVRAAARHSRGQTLNSSSPDVIRAMSTELFLNFLGVRMDSRKAEGMRFTINLITPDSGEKFLVEMENATLTNTPGFLADKPDLTITVNRADLEPIIAGLKTLEVQIQSGAMKLDGDPSLLKQLASTLVDFDPRFPIMPANGVGGGSAENAGSVNQALYRVYAPTTRACSRRSRSAMPSNGRPSPAEQRKG